MKYLSIMVMTISIFLVGCAQSYKRAASEPVTHLRNFDYNLKIKPVSGNDKRLSEFKGKKISIYYLAPRCPHCKTALPNIMKARAILDSLGYESLNLGIKYSSDEELTNFINESNLRGFHFKDENRAFANKYGTGAVPVFMVVNELGEIVRYNRVSDSLPIQVNQNLQCCKDN